jgi:hypothetical protein
MTTYTTELRWGWNLDVSVRRAATEGCRGCNGRGPGGHILFLKERRYERIQQLPAHLCTCLEIRMQDKMKT